MSYSLKHVQWRFKQRISKHFSLIQKGSVDNSTDPFYFYYTLKLLIARSLVHQFKEMLTIML